MTLYDRKIHRPGEPGDANNPAIDHFLGTVIATAERSRMLAPGDRVLVAVSGGPDSVALWRALSYMAPRLSLTLGMVHINYHLRGEESDADEKFCRALARQFGARLYVRSRRRRIAGQTHNLQQWARRERYAVFTTLTERERFDRIAVGHQYDDQVETIVVGLLGGRETFAMGGMPRTRGRIIRPLLDCRHAEILDFLKAIDQPYREDRSNLDQRYLRNRVRHSILPEWREKYNPRIDHMLFRWAERAAEQNDYMDAAAVRHIAGAQTGWGRGWIALDAGRFRRLDRRLDFHILRRVAERLNLPDVLPGEQLVRRFGELIVSGRTGQKLEWGRALIECARSAVVFYPRKPGVPKAVKISIEGMNVAENWDLTVDCRRRARPPDEQVSLPRNSRRFLGAANAIRPPVVLRGPRPGERMRPLGMAGSRKIYDILADAGVPSLLRPISPVLEDRDGVFWVIGHRQDDRVKVTARTREVLMITVNQAAGDRG